MERAAVFRTCFAESDCIEGVSDQTDFAQAWECCEGRDASSDLLQAWKLVDEFALAEADRSLLKLLLELDKMGADMQLLRGSSEEVG